MKAQVIKDKNNHPVAVLMDYTQYKNWKTTLEDKSDYISGIKAKRLRKSSIDLKDFKNRHSL